MGYLYRFEMRLKGAPNHQDILLAKTEEGSGRHARGARLEKLGIRRRGINTDRDLTTIYLILYRVMEPAAAVEDSSTCRAIFLAGSGSSE